MFIFVSHFESGLQHISILNQISKVNKSIFTTHLVLMLQFYVALTWCVRFQTTCMWQFLISSVNSNDHVAGDLFQFCSVTKKKKEGTQNSSC